jgi:protein-disulfide isomerase
MKRFLPFIIIAAVGLLTVGIATAVYKNKMQTPPPQPATSRESTGPGILAAPIGSDEQSGGQTLHVRGPKDAPVVLEIYGDFQCPTCATTSKAIDELEKDYKGKLKIVFHEFPLAMHKHALKAARAAEAAALQGKFWEMHDALYQYQNVWSEAANADFFFDSYAGLIGLDLQRFRRDRMSLETQAKVMEDGKSGELRGVRNTPTIFINGVEARGAFTKDKLQEAINSALAAKKQA